MKKLKTERNKIPRNSSKDIFPGIPGVRVKLRVVGHLYGTLLFDEPIARALRL